MIQLLRSFAVLAVLATALPFTGCGGQPETQEAPPTANDTAAPGVDPDDVPITEADVKLPANYAEAIPQIKSYRDTIKSAVEAGTPSKAHRPLDELDIVLNKLPTIAKDSGIAKEHWETINTSAQELRNLFNQVHSAIDEKREPDYKAVAQPIDEQIGRLESVPQP
ncbi:MAG: hypothetical protein HY000_09480 [Planctomycetes bacterium]|nr:hypothetical protein [Planctomycetota bacterium]